MKEFNINEGIGGFTVGYYSTDSVQATNASWTRQSRFVGPSKPSVKTVCEVPIAVKENHFVINNKRDLLFGGDGEFYNINIGGKINWHYKDIRNINDRFFFTSPILLKSGYVIFGTSGVWDSKGHKVMALDINGNIEWEFNCEDGVSSTCVTDSEGNIYFTTYGSKLYSIDVEGNLRWIFRYEAEFSLTPVISKDCKIYISSYDEFMMILDLSGNLLEKFEIGTCGPHSFPVLDQRGNLYFKTNMIDDIQLISLDSLGTINWIFSPKRGDIITSPALSEAGFIVVGATFFQLICVDCDGTEIWTAEVEGFMSHPPIVDVNSNIYTVSYKEIRGKGYSYLQSFSQEGKENWKIKMEGILTLPVLISDGEIVLLLNKTSGWMQQTQVITVT
jgi:outer membrane protein assembly factor BamB